MQKIVAAQNAFAAIRTDGRVVTWGTLAEIVRCVLLQMVQSHASPMPARSVFDHVLRIFTEALSLLVTGLG